MAFCRTIVSRDYESIRILTALLKDREIGAEDCGDYDTGESRLAEKRYALAIVDCEDQTAALSLIAATRADPVKCGDFRLSPWSTRETKLVNCLTGA